MNGLVGFGRRSMVVAAVAAALLTAAGCSSSVTKDQLQTSIATQLTGKGVAIDNNAVTCPSDLKAEVGQSTRCSITTGGQPVDVVVKVSSVDGSTVNYDLTTEARPVAKATLESEVGKQVGQQAGVTIDKTDCQGDLQPQVGQSTNCTVSGGGDTLDVKVTVTTVDGGRVNFSIVPT